MAENGRFLIVGLGNPGREYENNRHNIGFMLVDRLADHFGFSLSRVQQRAIVGSGRVAGRPVILAKPQTFMNNSGVSVGPLLNFYKIPTQHLLVAYDELDLPLGTIRLREQGGSGGHNGMKSIIGRIGEGFPRLRLGIDRPPGRMPPAAYVLQDFGTDELPVVEHMLAEAVAAVVTFVEEGITMAMSRHNGRVMSNE